MNKLRRTRIEKCSPFNHRSSCFALRIGLRLFQKHVILQARYASFAYRRINELAGRRSRGFRNARSVQETDSAGQALHSRARPCCVQKSLCISIRNWKMSSWPLSSSSLHVRAVLHIAPGPSWSYDSGSQASLCCSNQFPFPEGVLRESRHRKASGSTGAAVGAMTFREFGI